MLLSSVPHVHKKYAYNVPIFILDIVIDSTIYWKGFLEAGNTQSEDCLTINVLRPAGVNESSALPVMVYVYGGGFLGTFSLF